MKLAGGGGGGWYFLFSPFSIFCLRVIITTVVREEIK